MGRKRSNAQKERPPDPATILIAATAAQAVGTLAAGAEAQRVGEANAALARREAKLSRQKAQLERQKAERTAEAQRREARRRRGRSRAAAGGSGAIVSGSPIDLLAEQALEDELAIQNTLFEGQLGARGAEEAATAAEEEARQSIARGKFARRQSILKAGAQIGFGLNRAGVFDKDPTPSFSNVKNKPGAFNPDTSVFG